MSQPLIKEKHINVCDGIYMLIQICVTSLKTQRCFSSLPSFPFWVLFPQRPAFQPEVEPACRNLKLEHGVVTLSFSRIMMSALLSTTRRWEDWSTQTQNDLVLLLLVPEKTEMSFSLSQTFISYFSGLHDRPKREHGRLWVCRANGKTVWFFCNSH